MSFTSKWARLGLQKHFGEDSFLMQFLVLITAVCSGSEQEIIELCLSFSSGTAAGYDHISIDLVEDCAHFICRPLSHIINLSITSGIVLINRKSLVLYPNLVLSHIFQIIHLFLPSCVFQNSRRVIYNRLFDYLSKHNMLSDNSVQLSQTSLN